MQVKTIVRTHIIIMAPTHSSLFATNNKSLRKREKKRKLRQSNSLLEQKVHVCVSWLLLLAAACWAATTIRSSSGLSCESIWAFCSWRQTHTRHKQEEGERKWNNLAKSAAAAARSKSNSLSSSTSACSWLSLLLHCFCSNFERDNKNCCSQAAF